MLLRVIEREVLGHQLLAGQLAAQQEQLAGRLHTLQLVDVGGGDQRRICTWQPSEYGLTCAWNAFALGGEAGAFLRPVDAVELRSFDLETVRSVYFGEESGGFPVARAADGAARDIHA